MVKKKSKKKKESLVDSSCLSEISTEAKHLLVDFSIKRAMEDLDVSRLDHALLKIRGRETDDGERLSAKQVWEREWRDALLANAENWELLGDLVSSVPTKGDYKGSKIIIVNKRIPVRKLMAEGKLPQHLDEFSNVK